MSSNINPTNINGAYPIAGQDNDSQGFRDNFTNIRTNLSHAKFELEELQRNAILKSPLVGSGPIDNSFAGVLLTGAQTKGFTESVIDHGSKPGGVTFDFTMGDLQKVIVTGTTLSTEFTNWPAAGVYATIRVWFVAPSSSTAPMGAIVFPASVTAGVGNILGLSMAGSSPVLTPTRVGDYFIEFGTIDGGLTVTAVLLTSPVTAEEYVLNSVNNNMKGHILSNFTAKTSTLASTASTVAIDLSVADFHQVTTSQAIDLSFDNWPTTGYATTKVLFNVTSTAHTITFPAAVSIGLNKIPGVVGQVLTPSIGAYLLEFGSMNGGASVLVISQITP